MSDSLPHRLYMEPTAGNKTNVVIAGYPKSGTHWVSWLVADLTQSQQIENLPTKQNFSKTDEKGVSKDGFHCYKTHLTLEEIRGGFAHNQDIQVIHVVRDPRDIVISGAHFFPIVFHWISKVKGLFPIGGSLYAKLRWSVTRFVSMSYKQRRMTLAILRGDETLNEWFRLGWVGYVSSFNDSDVLMIRYEDMLNDPLQQCQRICDFLGLNATHEELQTTINAQSFSQKNFIGKQGYKIMRKGQSGYWRDELEAKCLAQITSEIGPDIQFYGYP